MDGWMDVDEGEVKEWEVEEEVEVEEVIVEEEEVTWSCSSSSLLSPCLVSSLSHSSSPDILATSSLSPASTTAGSCGGCTPCTRTSKTTPVSYIF